MSGIQTIIPAFILAGFTVECFITGLGVGMNLGDGDVSDEFDSENEENEENFKEMFLAV